MTATFFAQLESTGKGAVQTREGLFAQLQYELETHIAVEEKLFYPKLQKTAEGRPLIATRWRHAVHTVWIARLFLLCVKSWTERAYHKLIYFNEVDKGGHFAAWDIRNSLRPKCVLRSDRRARWSEEQARNGRAVLDVTLRQHRLELDRRLRMSKESNNDRLSLSGTQASYQRASHQSENSIMRNARIAWLCFVGLMIISICACVNGAYSQSNNLRSNQGTAGEPYPNMPSIAPIGVRIGKYMDVPGSAQGPAIDPAKGYRLQDLGSGLYMITDNAIQSMFLVYDRGVVVIDAPQTLAAHIPQAIAEVSDRPITHMIYSHSHADHIGGTKALGVHPVIIAHEETLRLLKRAADPDRPLPTVTFSDKYTLHVGSQVLELSYHGNAHEPGNIFIYAPAQRVLMVVDIVFPGWMPWRRFAVAQDIPGYFAQVEEIRMMDWDTFVGGHVARTGTHADVDVQAEFNRDVKQAAATALATTKLGEGLNPLDRNNPWAIFDNYIDRVAAQCVNTLTPKWSTKLAGFDVYIWDQCYAMEQSLRID